MDAAVSEIHRYPVRPEGFAEPLFLTSEHRKEIAEHLAASGWLSKASEASSSPPDRASPEQRCHLLRRADGVCLVRRESKGQGRGRPRWRKQRVREVLERWRDVRDWWEPAGGADLLLFRVLLCGGVVLDLAYERASRQWSVAGVVD